MTPTTTTGAQGPSKLRKSQLLVLLVGFVALALVVSAYALGNSADASQTAVGADGRLEVGGVVYEFTPSTCTITDGDFVAAGSGEIGGQTFWVSASGDALNLAVGTVSELDRPADDALWLTSVDQIDWASQDGELWAASAMQDERQVDSTRMWGELSLNCTSA